MTKKSFYELLDLTLVEVAVREKDNNDSYLTDLYRQLDDIKHTLQNKKDSLNWEDIYDKYNIDIFADVYFAKDELMYGRLKDIFYGLVNFPFLQDV